MDIKYEIKNYRNLKADIEQLKNHIELMRMDKMPSCTQVLSDMPKAQSVSSQTERVVEILLQMNDTLKSLEIKLNIIDTEISRLTKDKIQYLRYYTEGVNVFELSRILYRSNKYIYTKIDKILDEVENNYIRYKRGQNME